MKSILCTIMTSLLLSGCGYTIISRRDLEWTKEAWRAIGQMEGVNKMLEVHK